MISKESAGGNSSKLFESPMKNSGSDKFDLPCLFTYG